MGSAPFGAGREGKRQWCRSPSFTARTRTAPLHGRAPSRAPHATAGDSHRALRSRQCPLPVLATSGKVTCVVERRALRCASAALVHSLRVLKGGAAAFSFGVRQSGSLLRQVCNRFIRCNPRALRRITSKQKPQKNRADRATMLDEYRAIAREALCYTVRPSQYLLPRISEGLRRFCLKRRRLNSQRPSNDCRISAARPS